MRSSTRVMLAFGTGLMLAGAVAPAWAQEATLTFRFNDPDQEQMRAALDQFEKANPDIKVELERMAWKDARDQFLREAAVSTGPDVVHIAFVWAKEFGEAGAVLPLADPLEQSPPPNGLDDFIAMDLATGNDGSIYALPWTTDTWAMVYRTDLLEEAGIDKLPETWEELKDASAKIHEATGKSGFMFPAGSSASGTLWFLANYYWWSNGEALVERKEDGSFGMDLTAADVTEAMDYFKSYLDDGEMPTSMLGVSDWADPAIIRGLVEGQNAIGIMPPNTFQAVLDAYAAAHPGEKLPFVSGPVPKGSETRATHLGGRMLAINANTENPEAAWKLVRFLAEEEIFTDYYTTQFPAQRSLLEEIEFAPEMEGYAEQLMHARSWGAYADGPAPIGAMWNAVGRGFGAALSGQRTTAEAGEEVVETVGKMLADGQ